VLREVGALVLSLQARGETTSRKCPLHCQHVESGVFLFVQTNDNVLVGQGRASRWLWADHHVEGDVRNVCLSSLPLLLAVSFAVMARCVLCAGRRQRSASRVHSEAWN
jgi:hypothetical protein